MAHVSRRTAFAVVIAIYAAAAAGAAGVALAARGRGHHPITVVLAADLTATALVFAASTVLANSSLYDPYWSIVPPALAIAWATAAPGAFPAGAGTRQIVLLALVLVWSLRLTVNWALAWRGMGHEDWRYRDLRQRVANRPPWWLVNLAGVQLMPTLLVFVASLSLWPALVTRGRALGLLDLVAFGCAAGAILLEAAADFQLRRFIALPANRGRIANQGLWAWSRHPNYLGEIGFWWALWLFGAAADPTWWWTVIGPLAMVVLFEAVSIPLMERHLMEHRGYAEHMRRVPRLLPMPWRRAVPTGGPDSDR
jgi:steroid 5-alpha reductase family enzyme